eukprot:381900_1
MYSEYYVLFALTTVALILFLESMNRYFQKNRSKYPKGPMHLPIIGNILQIATHNGDMISYIQSLKKYGDISMIRIGSQRIVYLHTIEMVNLVFGKKKFNIYHRPSAQNPESFGTIKYTHSELGLTLTNGKIWKDKRKLFQSLLVSHMNTSFLNTIHDYSLNKCIIPILNEVANTSKLWFPAKYLHFISLNVSYFSIFQKKLDFNTDHSKIELIKVMGDKLTRDFAIIHVLKWFKIWKWISSTNMFAKYFDMMRVYTTTIDEWLLEHYSDIYDGQNILDLQSVNVFIKHYAKHSSSKQSTAEEFKKIILHQFMEFFMTSTETSAMMSEYALLLLAKYENIQELIYSELIHVCTANNINISDENIQITAKILNKLHYLKAFIAESNRISVPTALPFGLPHCNIEKEIQINKNTIIPKDSVIFIDTSVNIYDKYWQNKNVKDINIDLWLDKNKHFNANLNKNKNIEFGIGERTCAGKAFVLRNFYILFAKLIIKYKFVYPKGQSDIFETKESMLNGSNTFHAQLLGIKVIQRHSTEN